MVGRTIERVYVTVAAVVVLVPVYFVLVEDVSPALLIPGVFGAVGIFLVGSGVRALYRGTARIRGGSVDRASNPLFFWWVVLGGHFGFGTSALVFAYEQFQIAARNLTG